MIERSYPDGAHDYASKAEEKQRLDTAMAGTPRGAVIVSLIAVGALMVGWLGLYFLVFLPRGPVG